ncbi:cytochrome c maturation protein CcmE [Sphingomonas sp.]|uniref:cytochrome c maturation protein CcmE n=1 Tax=Sphingomonas sp. TaxID=28214 RepID=UPI00325FCC72
MKPKHQRLILLLVALAAVTGAVLLAMWGLRDRASYFYTASDIVSGKAAGQGDRTVRLGGMVEKGSLTRAADGVTVSFRVTDGPARVPVTYRGILPDLFREGSGVVAEGRVTAAAFSADTILAKHDERYMPPQLGNQAAEHRAARTLAK